MAQPDLGRWTELLAPELEKPYFSRLLAQVAAADDDFVVYPPQAQRLRALELTLPEQVRVVILGQDPYHGPGQANGLAFSVEAGAPLPPSLRNIFAELRSDLGVPPPPDGDLSGWAAQGVLLLNTVLTVNRAAANSHRDFGWQTFTDAVLAALAQLPQPVVFVLWGAQAQKKAGLAASSPHPRLVLSSPHPSPLSSYRGFFGSRPFSQINEFLTAHGAQPVDFSRGRAP